MQLSNMEEQEIFQAQMIERQHQELEQNLELVETQISELEQFREELGFLIKSKEKKALSLLGRGVYMETSIQDKTKLFVEVGSNVVVKKTPEEAMNVIEGQVSRLKNARLKIISHIETYQIKLQEMISQMSNLQ